MVYMATLTEKYEEGNNKKYFKSWTKNLTEWQAKVKLSAFNLYILFLWGCNMRNKLYYGVIVKFPVKVNFSDMNVDCTSLAHKLF